MPLKSDQNRIRYERLVLAETGFAQKQLYVRLWHLASAGLIALGFAGIVGCFAPAGAAGLLLFAAAVYTAGLVLADAGSGSVRTALFCAPVLVAVLAPPAGFYAGFLHFINQCITVCNVRYGAFLTLFSAPDCTAWNAVQFELALLAALCWGAYAVAHVKGVGQGVLAVVLGVALIGLGGLSVSAPLCAALSLGGILNWVEKTTGYGGIRKGAAFLTPLLAVLCIAAVLIANNLTGADANMAQLHSAAAQRINTLRYGRDTLPRGDLRLAEQLSHGTDETLQVTFSGTPQELYLKGFVGGEFDQGAWQQPSAEIYHGDNSGIIRWLSQNGLSTPFQMGEYFSLSQSGAAAVRNTVSVNNLGAYRKYLYLPYQSTALSERGWRLNGDTQPLATGFFGARRYAVSMLGPANFQQSLIREELDPQKAGTEEFRQAETVYSLFAAENYLTLPQETRTAVQKLFFGTEDWQNAGISEITTRIRVVLQGYLEYSASPTPYSGETDFIAWLQQGNQKGNSAYYATASVLAYRCAGVPARYAEGYFFSDSQAKNLADSRKNTVTLTDFDAHAWVEIYLGGVGWIPVETTPGYYYAEYTVSQVLGQPQSAVNIADNENENQLGGSTTDTLPTMEKPPVEPETTIHRTIHLLGLLLLAAIVLWLAYSAAQLQAALRHALRQKAIRRAQPSRAVRLMFRQVFALLHAAGFAADESRPLDALPLFEQNFPAIEPEEYLWLVGILQKTVFGEIEPTQGELISVQRFLQRLEKTAYQTAPRSRRPLMKFGCAFYAD